MSSHDLFERRCSVKGKATASQLKDYLDQAIHPIHIVVSLERVRTSVKDPHPLYNSIERLRRHPRMGSIIFVTPNPTLRFGVGLLAQFLGAQFFVVETFQQIVPVLKKLQSDLKPKTGLLPSALSVPGNRIE